MKIKLEKVRLPERKFRRPRAPKVMMYDDAINKMQKGESFVIKTHKESIDVRNCINFWKKQGNTAVFTVRKMTDKEYRCWRLA